MLTASVEDYLERILEPINTKGCDIVPPGAGRARIIRMGFSEQILCRDASLRSRRGYLSPRHQAREHLAILMYIFAKGPLNES